MRDENTTDAPTGASELTITGIPAFETGFVETLLDLVLTNVDAEFTPEHIEAARAACKAIGCAVLMAQQLGPRVEVETLIAFVANAVVEAQP